MLGLALVVEFVKARALAACMHVALAFLQASLEGSRCNEALLRLEVFFVLREKVDRGLLCYVFCRGYRRVSVVET